MTSLLNESTRTAVEGPGSLPVESGQRIVAPPLSDSPSLTDLPAKSSPNPLLLLPQEQKENIFIWLREGSDHDAINLRLQDAGLPSATRREIDQFFTAYAHERWTRRIDRAAEEADALIALVRRSPGQIPEAVLAALGQEAFRQIASGKVESADLARYTSLFLRAREQDRAERALQLQNEKLRLDHRTATERALDAFARELPQHPAALAAFQHLKNQLLDQTEHLEET